MDGLYRVATQEGPIKLFNGATVASSRAILVTIGQVCVGSVVWGLVEEMVWYSSVYTEKRSYNTEFFFLEF